MNSGGSQAAQPPAINGVRLQTSTYGTVIPMLWGQTRITGNIIWVGDFIATNADNGGGK